MLILVIEETFRDPGRNAIQAPQIDMIRTEVPLIQWTGS
jgi:hypothetical protein